MKKKLLKSFILTMPLLFALSACGETKKPTEEVVDKDTDKVKEIEVTKYNVTFDTDGGNNIESKSVEENGKIEKPTNPTKDKYTFLGWYLNDELFDFNTNINSNITLKAKWRNNSTVTLNRLDSNVTYDIETTFNDNYFDNPSNVFSNDLARFSFNMSAINLGDDRVYNFFDALDFDNIFLIKQSDDSYQGVSYSFAHKKIGNDDLVAVSIRGMRYYEEWAGNFILGSDGNHKNFDECAHIVYDSLKKYMASYSANTKMLISGYSRSAAISDIVADMIMKDTNQFVQNDNLYVYTFEAPRGLDINIAVAYPNVFNIINSADMVTYLPMEEFGFSRCGIDIDIYNPNVSTIIKEFDNDFKLAEFKKYLGNDVKKDTDLPKAVIKNLISYRANSTSDTYQEDLKYEIYTREKFDENLSPTVQYLFNFVFDTNTETLNRMVTGMISLFSNDIMTAIKTFTDGEKLHDFVAKYLDEDNITYDDEDLRDASNKLVGILARNTSFLMFAYINSSNLGRMGFMHSPVIEYILLDYYLKNN